MIIHALMIPVIAKECFGDLCCGPSRILTDMFLYIFEQHGEAR